MSIKRPMPKPGIPTLKKPSISKQKRLTKRTSSVVEKKILNNPKQIVQKKTKKSVLGTCYLNKNCNAVLSRHVSKIQCKSEGGKSWKKTGGPCENI
ncbi:hypothetical protein [Nitrosopumilus sp.]|uniref:hypothetical protein n=1 Tax=Nitrosopumilus sp. TaxID=2024843 RepID=UPI0034A09C2D